MDKCPQCGFTEKVTGKPLNNVMNTYVQSDKTSYEVHLNSASEEVIFPADPEKNLAERKFIRKDVFEKRAKAPAPKTEPTTPPKQS